MDFTCERLALSRLLGRAASIASAKTATTALQCVLIEATAGRLTARATDLFMGVESTAEADVKTPGTVCVDARRASEIAKKLPTGEIRVRMVKNQLEISAGKSKFKLGTSPAEDYPQLPRMTAETIEVGRFEGRDLLRVLAQGSYAVATDETRPATCSTYVEAADGKLRVTSTDSARLTTSSLVADVRPSKLLIPLKGISELRKLCELQKDGQVVIASAGAVAFFVGGDVTASVQLATEIYPPAQKVIESAVGGIERRVRLLREEFVEAVERADIVAADNKGNPSIVLSFTAGKLRITAENTASDACEDEIECDADFELRTEASPKFLREAASALADDEISVGLSGPLGPIVITGTTSNECTGIVMPTRPR